MLEKEELEKRRLQKKVARRGVSALAQTVRGKWGDGRGLRMSKADGGQEIESLGELNI